MLVAVIKKKDKSILVLGLEDENVKRLLNDQPILKNMGKEGVTELEGWEVAILGPEDTARLLAHADEQTLQGAVFVRDLKRETSRDVD